MATSNSTPIYTTLTDVTLHCLEDLTCNRFQRPLCENVEHVAGAQSRDASLCHSRRNLYLVG